MTDNNLPQLVVFYNGLCPLCAAEITHYAALATKHNAPVSFVEIHEEKGIEALKVQGLTPDSAARRLYALNKGSLISGIDAFIALWYHLPWFRWLARIAKVPILKQVLARLYDKIAAPSLYKAHVRRMAAKKMP